MNYDVRLTETAAAMLLEISEQATQQQVAERISRLAVCPEDQGGFLKGALSRYRKCRAAGRRYRILYRIDEDNSVVIVVAIGARIPGDFRDIYQLAAHLLRDNSLE